MSALRRLAGRYGTREDAVDDLLRANVLVDLYEVVRARVRVRVRVRVRFRVRVGLGLGLGLRLGLGLGLGLA